MVTSSSGATKKLLLLSAIVAPTVIILILLAPKSHHHHHHRRKLQSPSPSPEPSAAAAGRRHCDGTLYPDLCVSTIAAIPGLSTKPLPEVIAATLNHTAGEVISSSRNFSDYLAARRRDLDPLQRRAISDCVELFRYTTESLRSSVSDLRRRRRNAAGDEEDDDDVMTLLSAAMANQETCLDGFAYIPGEGYRPTIERRLRHISKLVSNSLAMAKKISTKKKMKKKKPGLPEWLRAGDVQRLLMAAPAANGSSSPAPDLVVAKDGTGNFTTIGEAVAAAPEGSSSRFVIYIKAGAYFENVEVGRTKTNVMFVGDGIGKTVVKAGRNVVDGWTTFRSATVAVVGNGFLARGLTIENSAGPEKHQAVALRVGADLAAFYRCSFVGYQDTLYAHSLRQFYRECDVYGTVDFVFGDAAAVFQSCNLYARVPLPTQKNIFTAHGRADPNEVTGFSLQGCKIAAAADLRLLQSNGSGIGVRSYLGRPWKEFSRTVFMSSYMEELIDPAGWLEWDGEFAVDTLFYGEYRNGGPGSNTTARVAWPGFRVINSSSEAAEFTAGSFIQGDLWLNSTDTPFFLGLIS